MSITLTKTFSGSLVITAINENFYTIEKVLKEGFLAADITGTFTHYHVNMYTGGRLTHMFVGTNPYISDERLLQEGIFESNFRKTGDAPDDLFAYTPDFISGVRTHEMMELLGRPGPSFYFDWQQDGINESLLAPGAGVAGWPPAKWPWTRYSKDECYSYWLTVPHASGRVYVHEPCVAKVTGNACGALKFSKAMFNMFFDMEGVEFLSPEQCSFNDGVTRCGLFVDTNPHVYSDEFANTNPNVKISSTGVQAAYCSWKQLQDLTIRDQHMSILQVPGLVKLKGGRNYNFSMRFRRANTIGHVYRGGMAPTFYDHDWEFKDIVSYLPTIYPSDRKFNGTATWGVTPVMYPYFANGITPHTILWASTNLQVEFMYGRGSVETDGWTYSYSASGAEFQQKP
jgi:hypothetical protein